MRLLTPLLWVSCAVAALWAGAGGCRSGVANVLCFGMGNVCVVLRQEAFKKNAPGFLHLGLVGGSEAAAALHMLVKQSADPIKVGTFRGFEALIPPDVARVVLGHHFIGSII